MGAASSSPTQARITQGADSRQGNLNGRSFGATSHIHKTKENKHVI
ncbi:MAG: hypothetical protein IJS08_00670 [Victivallales bacterium]|nr:hypothetical protein [Victivallales bacterium]